MALRLQWWSHQLHLYTIFRNEEYQCHIFSFFHTSFITNKQFNFFSFSTTKSHNKVSYFTHHTLNLCSCHFNQNIRIIFHKHTHFVYLIPAMRWICLVFSPSSSRHKVGCNTHHGSIPADTSTLPPSNADNHPIAQPLQLLDWKMGHTTNPPTQ